VESSLEEQRNFKEEEWWRDASKREVRPTLKEDV